MHEAKLYKKLKGGQVECQTCQWRCRINNGNLGVCRAYGNEGGVLKNLNYAKVSSLAVDPIEKKPLFHFYPGSLCFSLGTWGCNFHCKDCQNWQIACPENDEAMNLSRELQPQAAIDMAVENNCRGIAWTYNEPGIWFEYTFDSAKLAKERGLYTAYVTNGYSTIEALDTIGPYLDAWRVDIMGFSDKLYKQLARGSKWRRILEVGSRAKRKGQMQREVVTNIVPTWNDDDEQLNGIARWIKEELGELTPWHVTRFYPHRQMTDLPSTPIATLERAYDIGRKAGLRFVYTGNAPGHKYEATTCYGCGSKIIDRVGYQTSVTGLNGSNCRFCGNGLNFISSSREGR